MTAKKLLYWIIPVTIFAITLRTSLYYSQSLFVISSDSLAEYNTYLEYVASSGRWYPISDNLLSSSLWTTLLPAWVQTVLKLNNPETVYRLSLACLISPLPAVTYLLARKYTTTLISLCLTFILFSTFYFQGFASYARMQVGLIFEVLILLALASNSKSKYYLVSLFSVGLVFSHYTVAIVFLISLLIAMILVRSKPIFLTTLILADSCFVWYFLVNPTVWYYAVGTARRTIESSMVPTNPFSGLGKDFINGQLFLLIRYGIEIIACLVSLWKTKNQQAYFLIALIVIGTFSVLNPAVGLWLGYFRPAYILLPVEIMSVAALWGMKQRPLLIPLLFAWSWFYH